MQIGPDPIAGCMTSHTPPKMVYIHGTRLFPARLAAPGKVAKPGTAAAGAAEGGDQAPSMSRCDCVTIEE